MADNDGASDVAVAQQPEAGGAGGGDEDGLVYKLVPAAAEPQNGQRKAKGKKGKKTKWVGLPVENMVVAGGPHHEERQSKGKGKGYGGRGTPNGRTGGKGGRGRGRGTNRSYNSGYGGDSYQNGYQQQNQYYQQDYGYDQSGYNGLYYAPQDPVVVAAYALTQIEYYFSLENLCRDVFLRSRLDSGGYIPVTMILTFNRVAAANPEYDAMLKVLETSELLELDSENEKIRLKTGWEQWLFPNQSGGRGVSPYIKVPEEEYVEEEGQEGEEGGEGAEPPAAPSAAQLEGKVEALALEGKAESESA